MEELIVTQLLPWISDNGALAACVIGLGYAVLRHDRGCVEHRAETCARLKTLEDGQTEILDRLQSIEEHLRR